MVVAPVIIRILLSEEFLVITSFIRILCLGMLLKTAAYALGYASFAKGDKKIYLFLEGGYANIANLILSVSFYYLWGLTGLAFSFVVNYILYYVIISYVDKKRYQYEVSKDVIVITTISFLSLGILLLLDFLIEGWIFYFTASVITSVTVIYFFVQLNKKTDLLQLVRSKILKK